MLDTLLSVLAPHYCISCGDFGEGLCEYCKYDIDSIHLEQCADCKKPLFNGHCSRCNLPYRQLIACYPREGVIDQLVDKYKYDSRRGYTKTLAFLLHNASPLLPSNSTIVPVPTSYDHVRQRGFDHTTLLAKEYARLSGHPMKNILGRRRNTRQVGASVQQRKAQVHNLFFAKKPLDSSGTYVIIDDVITTGSTIKAAADALQLAGASQIIVVALSYQPRDKKALPVV